MSNCHTKLTEKAVYNQHHLHMTDNSAYPEIILQERSASKCLPKVPNYNLESYGKGAFSVAGPLLWNSLPMDIRCQKSLAILKKTLKTFLYIKSFFLICNICTISFTFHFEFSALWALLWIQRYI